MFIDALSFGLGFVFCIIGDVLFALLNNLVIKIYYRRKLYKRTEQEWKEFYTWFEKEYKKKV